MRPTGEQEIVLTLQRFLEWAHNQGWQYTMVPFHLERFEGFLRERGVQSFEQVDTPLLLDFQRHLAAGRSPATVNGYRSTLRALWRYLLREEIVSQDVTKGIPLLHPDFFVPYLYLPQQLTRIERATAAAIGEVRFPAYRLGRRARHTALVLIRDCGLRVSEACHLNLTHYDRESRTLHIERTKFFKSRVIPLPRSTCVQINRYLYYRQRIAPDSPALFLSTTGTRLSRLGLEQSFQRVLQQLAIYKPRRRHRRTVYGSTNLHALRHSFAVRTLERWQAQGLDVEALLPLLSGYMGHVQVSYTATYLHLTPRLRQLASESFEAMVLPQLDRADEIDEDG